MMNNLLVKAEQVGTEGRIENYNFVEEDGTMKNFSKSEEKANDLNKKAYNELILSYSNKKSFGIVKSAKTKHLPKYDAKEA